MGAVKSGAAGPITKGAQSISGLLYAAQFLY